MNLHARECWDIEVIFELWKNLYLILVEIHPVISLVHAYNIMMVMHLCIII